MHRATLAAVHLAPAADLDGRRLGRLVLLIQCLLLLSRRPRLRQLQGGRGEVGGREGRGQQQPAVRLQLARVTPAPHSMHAACRATGPRPMRSAAQALGIDSPLLTPSCVPPSPFAASRWGQPPAAPPCTCSGIEWRIGGGLDACKQQHKGLALHLILVLALGYEVRLNSPSLAVRVVPLRIRLIAHHILLHLAHILQPPVGCRQAGRQAGKQAGGATPM